MLNNSQVNEIDACCLQAANSLQYGADPRALEDRYEYLLCDARLARWVVRCAAIILEGGTSVKGVPPRVVRGTRRGV